MRIHSRVASSSKLRLRSSHRAGLTLRVSHHAPAAWVAPSKDQDLLGGDQRAPATARKRKRRASRG